MMATFVEHSLWRSHRRQLMVRMFCGWGATSRSREGDPLQSLLR
jgi:hypothetical protein